MSSASPHILVVEDSDTQAMKLMFVLEDEGWQVSRAVTAEEGLEFLNQTLPDLIVVDYFLPGMNGDAFCRQVRMRASTRQVPLLMLTAAPSDATEVMVLDSGADDYLPKSEAFDVLLLRIQALLRKTLSKQPQLADHTFQQARILAIDDSPTYLAYLEAELQQEGYLVETAADGAAGLEKLTGVGFDCVLVDLVMPGMDGIQVCHHLSTLSKQMSNPLLILMLTAHDNTVELSRALEAGADDFVGKSNDISVLKGRVRALLRRKFSQDENQRLLQEIIYTKELEAQHALKAQQEAEARAALATELEQALKRLKASKQELEQLAYISAHDLQEPLRHLTNYTQLLNQRYGDQLDPKAGQYFHFIIENTARMKRQVSSLLSYLNVSSAEPSFELVALEQILARVSNSLEAMRHTSGARLSHAGPLPELRASSEHLHLLFWHLIQNAIQFRSADRTPEIQIGVQERPHEWVFWVQDNGIGIENQYHKQIFDIFQHLHTHSNHSTSGIGLAICRKIAELHQGQIWLESEADQGSRFYVSIAKILT